jgi:hypothetical protein
VDTEVETDGVGVTVESLFRVRKYHAIAPITTRTMIPITIPEVPELRP